MLEKIIFIHVPKTGGTTINTAMQNSFWQTKPDFNYRHIDIKTFHSTSGDIFKRANFEKYKGYNIITMLRDPVDRILSEYSFIKERRDFMKLLKPQPKNFDEYVDNMQTSNGMLKFLLGHKMYTKIKMNEEDLELVKSTIDELPIHVGIFEEFGKSLAYFSSETGIKWNRNIQIKRITFKRPKTQELSDDIIDKILVNNSLDIQLYEFVKSRFNAISTGIKSNVNFHGDKYDHAIPYAYNFCFFEFCMETKEFINQNLLFFKTMTHYLIQDLKLIDGKEFTSSWLQSFINHLQSQYPRSQSFIAVKKVYDKDSDPLASLEMIAKTLDLTFAESRTQELKSIKLMFDKSCVAIVKESYFKNLFRFSKK